LTPFFSCLIFYQKPKGKEERQMFDLARWNPFEELSSWHRDIDELFNRFAGRRLGGTSAAAWGEFFPPVETHMKDGQYVVRLDLPGVDAKEVEVTAEGGILTIKGERKKAHEAKDADYQYSEVFVGRFERRLPLPQGVDSEKLQARYHQGVLEISVPLPQALTGRKIPIHLEAPRSIEGKAA
jgi:HSP20 family protein